jgi:hypothetical protein
MSMITITYTADGTLIQGSRKGGIGGAGPVTWPIRPGRGAIAGPRLLQLARRLQKGRWLRP